MSDIGANFFQFLGDAARVVHREIGDNSSATPNESSTPTNEDPNSPAVTISISANKGSHHSARGDLWYEDPSDGLYGEGADGIITHIAAKASGSCPYMRELLGLPPLPVIAAAVAAAADSKNASVLGLTPPLRPNGLHEESFADDSAPASAFTNSPATLSPQRDAPPPAYHQPHNAYAHYHGHLSSHQQQHGVGGGVGMATLIPPNHPRVTASPAAALGCPFLAGKKKEEGSSVAAAVQGTCPITGKTGPLPQGHPIPKPQEGTIPSSSAPQGNTTAHPPTTGFKHQGEMEMAAASGCPFAARLKKAQKEAPPRDHLTKKGEADLVANDRENQSFLRVGPAPFSLDGDTKNAATASSSIVNTSAVSNMAVVAISAPTTIVPSTTTGTTQQGTLTAAANATTKCPFINVFANHIDSFLHRALMTSVLNRITLKSFLREKKILQKFAINSAVIGRKGRGSTATNRLIEAGAVDFSASPLPQQDEEIDESIHNVLGLSEDEVEVKCNEVLNLYIKNGTARPRITVTASGNGDGGDEDGKSASSAPLGVATAQPKLTPAVAAILAAAAANAAHLPPALKQRMAGNTEPQPPVVGKSDVTNPRPSSANTNTNTNTLPHTNNSTLPPLADSKEGLKVPLASEDVGGESRTHPPSGATTPNTLKARRIGEIEEDHDATVGATPSAVASMLSSMRLGKEVSLPMGLSFLNQATTRAEERYADMYLRVVSEACGIKSGITPPLRPPARMAGADGQPNPASLMVMMPPASLLTRVLADGSVPYETRGGQTASEVAPSNTNASNNSSTTKASVVAAASPPPKTFLHDVLCDLYVPRMRHFFSLWQHAVDAYEQLIASREAEVVQKGEEDVEEKPNCDSEQRRTTSEENEVDDEKKKSEAMFQQNLKDALHRVKGSADDLVHCLRVYSKMLHYHIMEPSSMRHVIEDLINRADNFVATQIEKEKVRLLTSAKKKREAEDRKKTFFSSSGASVGIGSAPIHVYPSAHRFFALATTFAIRESMPFRSLVAMEVGEGADLREAIVAELIRGHKILQMGCFVERPSTGRGGDNKEGPAFSKEENSSSTKNPTTSNSKTRTFAPHYAHPSSALETIKTALYVTALATISPVVSANSIPPSSSSSSSQQLSRSTAAPVNAVNRSSAPVVQNQKDKNGDVSSANNYEQEMTTGGNAKGSIASRKQTDDASTSVATNNINDNNGSNSVASKATTSPPKGDGGGVGGNKEAQTSTLTANAAPFSPPNGVHAQTQNTKVYGTGNSAPPYLVNPSMGTNAPSQNHPPRAHAPPNHFSNASVSNNNNNNNNNYTNPAHMALRHQPQQPTLSYNNNNNNGSHTNFNHNNNSNPNINMLFNAAGIVQPSQEQEQQQPTMVSSGPFHHQHFSPNPNLSAMMMPATSMNGQPLHASVMGNNRSQNGHYLGTLQQSNTNNNNNVVLLTVAPYTNVSVNPSGSATTGPLVVPFAPFLQYQQMLQQQQMTTQSQQQQQTSQSATSVIAAHFAVMQEANNNNNNNNRLRNQNGISNVLQQAHNANNNNNNNSLMNGPPNNATNYYNAPHSLPAALPPPSSSSSTIGGITFVPTVTGQPHQYHPHHNQQQGQGQGQQTQQQQQQRSQVPPFYQLSSSAPTVTSQAATTNKVGENNVSRQDVPQSTWNDTTATAVPSSMVSGGAAANCPFLRAQFPLGAPSIIPSSGGGSGNVSGALFPSPHQQQTQPQQYHSTNSTATSYFVGGGGGAGDKANSLTLNAVALPFGSTNVYPIAGYSNSIFAPSMSSSSAVATGVGVGGITVTPEAIAAVEELIAPVFQPKKGNGCALAPPSYNVATNNQ